MKLKWSYILSPALGVIAIFAVFAVAITWTGASVEEPAKEPLMPVTDIPYVAPPEEEVVVEEEPVVEEPVVEEEVYYEEEYYEEEYYDEPSYSSSYDGSSADFRRDGVIYYGDHSYTWYSQNVLPGGGLTELNNNGRHVDDRGFVCDGDGYIAVASDDYPMGTVVDTPFGEGRVYDSGSGSGNIDIYTDF